MIQRRRGYSVWGVAWVCAPLACTTSATGALDAAHGPEDVVVDAQGDVSVTDVIATDGAAIDVIATDGTAADGAVADVVTTDAARDGSAPADAPRDAGDADAIVAMTVDPPSATLRVTNLLTRPSQMFRAMGRTRDGRMLPVTAVWTVDRADVLTIDASGLARTTNTTGGDVVVTARYATFAASATVRVVFDFTVTPTGLTGAFPTTATAGSDAARTPAWVYPASETVFPQNVYKVLFQWRRGANDRFRINFESDRTRVSLVTDGTHPQCTMAGTGLGCFEPTLDVWRYLAGSNPRGSVRVTVDGATAAAPSTYYRSATLSVGFSRGPVPGAIYYWSTTVAGVRRATVGDAAPTNFLTPDQADRNCVACHTLSRRGNRLAADVGGNTLWEVEVSPTSPPPRIIASTGRMGIPMFWSTFSTDETRILAAARGVMTLRRATDGTAINTVPLAARTYGTQPDWAWDSAHVAFVQSATDRDRGVAGGRIATVEVRPGDAWGAVRVLVGSGANADTNQFPSFSWDSRWIAYAHSTGNGQNDLTTDLWLVGADGTSPRALARANTVISNGVITTPTVQDNMPTWAPSGVPDDYAWVAFSSTRDYGGVLSASSRLGRHEQLWVAAIDLTRAGGGADPSYPAFRLPFQGLDEDTHRPFWAIDRVAMTCTMAGNACATSGDCCAPLVCREGVCNTACAPADGACGSNADCCAPSVCLAGTCRAPCRPATATCASDAECCAPNTCVSGHCTPPPCRPTMGACATDGDCCAPNACRGGVCAPTCSPMSAACATSADCCAPAACVSGACRPPCVVSGAACATDTDCCAPNACRGGVCSPPCRATAATCTVNGDCCSGTCTRGVCAPPPCRVTGGSCSTDSDCCAGACVSGGCAPG